MKLKITLLLMGIAAFCLPMSAQAVSLGFLPQVVDDGISGGWSYPAGGRSYLGDALLTADRTIYTLKYSSTGRSVISVLESYQQPVSCYQGDIDGDGYGDLIVLFSESPSIRLLIGRRDGEKQVVDLVSEVRRYIAAGVAKIDSDSLPDLVLADSTSIIVLNRKVGANGFEFSQRFDSLMVSYPLAPHPLSLPKMLFGDFNGDNRTDMVYLGYVYINRAQGRFYTQQLPVVIGEKVKLLERTGDYDGDLKSELLWTSAQTRDMPVTVSIADYDAQRIFVRGSSFNTELPDITRSFRFDADGGGQLELGLFSAAANRAFAYSVSSTGIIKTSSRELFTVNSPRGNFIGPLGPESQGEVGWLFHNATNDSIYLGYTLRPYVDATLNAGLSDSLAAMAVAVGDYNSDNIQDVFIINSNGSNALYRGEPNGKFSEVASQAGVAQSNDGISCAWGDYNNDGYPDLIVAGLSLPDKLFFNRGDGTFADSSRILQYSRGTNRATSVSWGDINRDGYLDLVITNFDGPNWLLYNRGGHKFEPAAGGLGTTDKYYHTENASLVDVNQDGWLDIVLLNDSGPTRLLLGGAGGNWADATASCGLNPNTEYSKFGQSQSWGDFNGDGYPDLYITRAASDDMMFINNGAGATQHFKLVLSGKPGGSTYGRLGSAIDDFDSDGLTDLLITHTSQYGSYYEIPRNQVCLGDARGYPPILLADTLNAVKPGEILVEPLRFRQETSLPVTGDFDRDGDIDVLYANYLPNNANDLFHGSSLPLLFMRNGSSRANSVTIVLRRADNRNLAGSSVRVSFGGRTYWKTVSGGGGRIQTGPYLTFSLGNASQVDSMKVRWADGAEKTIIGPIYPGVFTWVDDYTAPRMEFVSWPGDQPSGGVVISSHVPLTGVLSVIDNSRITNMLVILRHLSAGTQDTLRLADKIVDGKLGFSFDAPAPGDSLDYYCTATDVYGNTSRLPAASGEYYRIVAEEGILLGDLNGDLKIDQNDMTRLLQIISGKGNSPTVRELAASDLNSDGRVDIFDLIEFIKLLNSGSNVQASTFD